MKNAKRLGVTLIELLIVIAIIAMLLQLVLPAVEASREAARRTQCGNNLRQLALGFQLHHDAHGHYPSSGWGWQWVGHPDRGYDENQPGGWAYNVLPFIEQGATRELGAGQADGSREKQLAILKANATTLPIFNCPSRRLPRPYPMVATGYGSDVFGFSPLLPEECWDGDGEKCQVARSDYAACAGNRDPVSEAGPNSLDEADEWLNDPGRDTSKSQNGVSYHLSAVRSAQVTDGLTNTYCVGEKYVPVAHYKTGKWQNDDLSIFSGFDGDMNRYTAEADGEVRRITSDVELPTSQHFGAAHLSVFLMTFCDGTVQPISYDVDPQIHRLSGGRNDEEISVESRD